MTSTPPRPVFLMPLGNDLAFQRTKDNILRAGMGKPGVAPTCLLLPQRGLPALVLRRKTKMGCSPKFLMARCLSSPLTDPSTRS